MEHSLKLLLAKLRPRETKELVADHVKELGVDQDARIVTLLVNKRYAFNAITCHDHIEQVIRGVKKAFGENYKTVIQLEIAQYPGEREKALPHAIHYQ